MCPPARLPRRENSAPTAKAPRQKGLQAAMKEAPLSSEGLPAFFTPAHLDNLVSTNDSRKAATQLLDELVKSKQLGGKFEAPSQSGRGWMTRTFAALHPCTSAAAHPCCMLPPLAAAILPPHAAGTSCGVSAVISDNLCTLRPVGEFHQASSLVERAPCLAAMAAISCQSTDSARPLRR